MNELFRSYDIRGIYGKELNEDFAYKLGKTYGSLVRYRVIISRDGRDSSKSLQKAFIDGVISTGTNVLDVGLLSTPATYLAIKLLNADGGVIVTASHNPKEWNGFKLCDRNGYTIDTKILKSTFNSGKFLKGKGGIDYYNFVDDYEGFLLDRVNVNDVNAVIDTGNGIAGIFDIFKKLGMKVVNKRVDGNFPNRSPEPNEKTLTKLINLVMDKDVSFGVGLDGDADRAIFVDSKGRVLDGSVSLAILSDKLLKIKHAKIVFDISSSSFIENFVKEHGGVPIVAKTGRKNIIKKMEEERADIGGESSGHLYFKELFNFDDGVYAILKMAEILSNKKLSEVVDKIVKYKLYLKKTVVKCDDDKKFEIVERLKNKLKRKYKNYIDIDGIKIIEDNSWFLIRASNTKPEIRVTVESKDESTTENLLNKIKKLVEDEVRINDQKSNNFGSWKR